MYNYFQTPDRHKTLPYPNLLPLFTFPNSQLSSLLDHTQFLHFCFFCSPHVLLQVFVNASTLLGSRDPDKFLNRPEYRTNLLDPPSTAVDNSLGTVSNPWFLSTLATDNGSCASRTSSSSTA